MENSLLLVKELPVHPKSVLGAYISKFETPSVLRIHTKDGLKKYNTKPLFDNKYLVIFENIKIFETNISFINLNLMFVLVLCSSESMLKEVKEICNKFSLRYKIYINEFTKSDAIDLMFSFTKEKLSESFINAVIRHVGLHPQRIINAMVICEQVGYTQSNVKKYVDKYNYVNLLTDVIGVLIGIERSKTKYNRVLLYLYNNRYWFDKYVKPTLCEELENLVKIYMDLMTGELTIYNVIDYSAAKRLPRYKIRYALDMVEEKSFVELLSLKSFIEHSSLIDIILKMI